MALVSGGRSTLNPDAPPFVPAAYRQVEDFSPEWWQLVTTTTWFRDYWLTQHQDEEDEYCNDEENYNGDVADLLPDTFDLDADDFEIQFADSVESYENEWSPFPSDGMLANVGFVMEAEAPRKEMNPKSGPC